MCGILGLVGSIHTDTFKTCLDTLAHRGPDGQGIWNGEGCMLGHRRLAIIDLSEIANQPFEILDRYVVVFNGEIYNYKEVRDELKKDGITLRSEGDTEVLLYAYLKWGPECWRKLNGMWALAIWDKVTGELFMSRDRLGKKPLYFCQTSEFFAFASEMKALYPLVGHEINHKQVERARVLNYFYEQENETLIHHIHRFPAGHFGFYKNRELKTTRFYRVEEERHSVPTDFNEQAAMFRELFLDACKLRMRSDVQIGTALSGGLDSSATICAMSAIGKSNNQDFQKDWQHAYVASFPGTPIDETKYAEQVVNHIGIPATYVNIDPLADIDNLSKYLYLFEDLYHTSPVPMIQLYAAVKANGTTVTIDGHGSDELFAGYPFDVIVALQDAGLNPGAFTDVLDTYTGMTEEKYGVKDIAWHSAKILKNKITKSLSGASKLQPRKFDFDYLNSRLYSSTFESVLPTLLRNYDHYSMISGVEVRMPFLDYRIVEFAFSIGWQSKVRNGFSKAIVREALKDLIPSDIVWRKSKIGFNAPFTQWIQGPLKEWVNDITHSSGFNSSSIIHPEEVRQRLNAVINNRNADFLAGEKAWKSLMPYLWEKSFEYAGK